MRAFIAGLGLAFILSMAPSVALADSGEDGDVQNNNDDPGMVALHGAAKDLQEATSSLRSECSDKTDAKCKAAFMAARAAFKAAREKAIAEHLAFKEEQKKAREAAKQKAKDALKDKVTTQAKDRAARNHQNDDKNAGNKNTQTNDGKNNDSQAGKNDQGNGTTTNAAPKPLVKLPEPSRSAMPSTSPKPIETPKPSATPRG
jgi:hypothetical protein